MDFKDEALYLRMRLLRLHGFNRILYPRKSKKWGNIEECIIEKTSYNHIRDAARVVLPDTYTQEAANQAEFALAEINGIEAYSNAELLKRHVNETLGLWRLKLMMASIYRSCGGEYVGADQDLLVEAALDAGGKGLDS